MSHNPTQPITHARLTALINSYGCSPTLWPEDERSEALALLKASPDLQTLCDQEKPLDDVLTQYRQREDSTLNQDAVDFLERRIMRQLPEQDSPANNVTMLNQPKHKPQRFTIWAGSIAASVLVAVVSFGIFNQQFSTNVDKSTHTSTSSPVQLVSDEFAQWAWEDITDELLDDESDNMPATIYALLE